MHSLIPVQSEADIPEKYRGTPIQLLLEYHNLGRQHDQYTAAKLLVGMCMDNRKSLNIPNNFSFILRAGGANLRQSEFKVSFAIAVAGIECIALIGHTQCGMVNLASRKKDFVEGLVQRAGWDEESAKDHFHQFAPIFEIRNETDFVLHEAKRLRRRYPKVLIAPMLYRVEDGLLYFIKDDETGDVG